MMRTTFWVAVVAAATMLSTSAWAAGTCCAPCEQVAVQECVERVIQVPTWVTETQTVKCLEYRPEQRERTITVMKSVPVEQTVERQYTVMVPQTKTRTVTYTVAKPVWEEKEVEYTVMVPHQETKQGVRHVCRSVPVTETRTVVKDEGHWEDREVTVPVVRRVALRARRMARRAQRLGCCTPCVETCCTCEVTQVCKVWVPNPVEHEIEVTVMKQEVVEEPYEYVVTRCEPETRTKTIRVCRMEYEEKTKEVEYTVCVPETRTRTLTYTSYRCEPEEKTVSCTVMVPHEVEREVQVCVCRMVPKTVTCCRPKCCCCR